MKTRSPSERAGKAFEFVAGVDEDGIIDGKAPATWLRYRSVWGQYLEWCERKALPPMPIKAQDLKLYVRDLSVSGKAATTIETTVAAIATVHRLNGHSIDRTAIVEQLKAARRRARPVRRARPLMAFELKEILETLDPSQPRDARDGCLLCVGWAAALRQNELVTLDWIRAGDQINGGLGFLTLEKEGVEVTLLSSKSSQITPVVLPVPAEQMPSLRTWLDAWIAIAQPEPGSPLFRAIHGKALISSERMAPESVADLIRRRARLILLRRGMSRQEAGIASRAFSGHSLRRGYCSSAAQQGIPEYLIRQRSRHGSPAVVAKYIGLAQSWKAAGLAGVGF